VLVLLLVLVVAVLLEGVSLVAIELLLLVALVPQLCRQLADGAAPGLHGGRSHPWCTRAAPGPSPRPLQLLGTGAEKGSHSGQLAEGPGKAEACACELPHVGCMLRLNCGSFCPGQSMRALQEQPSPMPWPRGAGSVPPAAGSCLCGGARCAPALPGEASLGAGELEATARAASEQLLCAGPMLPGQACLPDEESESPLRSCPAPNQELAFSQLLGGRIRCLGGGLPTHGPVTSFAH